MTDLGSIQISPWDVAIILLYLGGIMAFGIWSGRGQRSTRDYFLGGRTLPWWGVGLAIVATETSAVTFLGVPALAFGGDLTLLQIILGYVVARVVLAIYVVPHYFRGEIYSPYQLLSDVFGTGARRAAALLFLVAGTLAAGVRVYVTCIPLQLMLHVEILTAILLFIGLSLVYTWVGGIRAVIWTEVVQFLLFVGGGLFTLVYIPWKLGLGWETLSIEASAAGKLVWFRSHFSWSLPFNIWMGVFGATAQVMASHGADQLIVQRVLTCRNIAEGRRALILSAVIIFPLFLVFLLTGTGLWLYYQHVAMTVPLPETTTGMSQNDYVFPIFILTEMPPLIRGLMIVAILAAAMSSVSAALSALASVAVMDLMRPAPGQDERGALRISRWATAGWAVLLVGVAFASRETSFVLNTALSLTGLTSGAMLGGLLLALTRRRQRGGPIVLGMLASLVLMCLLHLLPRLEWTRAAWQKHVGDPLGWPWYALIGTLFTIAVAWIATRYTERERTS